MRFLLDQDVYAATARFLSQLKHDVLPVAQIGLAQGTDTEVLRMAAEQNRILVTRDRDFGALVFAENLQTGVIYLRISPSTLRSVHRELERLLQAHTEEQLAKAFVVVEPGRHRIRRLAR